VQEPDRDGKGRSLVLFKDAPYEHVIAFLEEYGFHEKSAEADRRRLLGYIEKRLRAGSLKRWNVAVIGSNRPGARPYLVTSRTSVGMVRRGRIDGEAPRLPGEPADIKTLTSPRDTTVDLALPANSENLKRSQIDQLRRSQFPDTGLLLLYPIDPVSDTNVAGRSPLNAPTSVVMGAALLFPRPKGADDEVEAEFEYYQAKLVEQDDADALELDDEEDV
jgi:hypothetical protein